MLNLLYYHSYQIAILYINFFYKKTNIFHHFPIMISHFREMARRPRRFASYVAEMCKILHKKTKNGRQNIFRSDKKRGAHRVAFHILFPVISNRLSSRRNATRSFDEDLISRCRSDRFPQTSANMRQNHFHICRKRHTSAAAETGPDGAASYFSPGGRSHA